MIDMIFFIIIYYNLSEAVIYELILCCIQENALKHYTFGRINYEMDENIGFVLDVIVVATNDSDLCNCW